jgi:drug/metabolite transporter (DMT)-like permease
MAESISTSSQPAPNGRFHIRMVLAFLAIYILWGTTLLAIRIAVAEIPPLLAAGARFFVAGLVLFTFMRLKGATTPTRRQWRTLLVMSLLMFVGDYAALFWAEKYVPSGLTAVLLATIPLFTFALDMLMPGRPPFRWMALAATLLGFAGVGVLLSPGMHGSLPLLPCAAVLAGSLSWSLGTVLSRSMDQPASRPLTSGGTMLLGGVILLLLSLACGEMRGISPISARATLAELYLIIFGSLVAYTAFVWLLAHLPPTRISSYAYVNPVVAVALGYFAAAEPITPRMLLGAAIVLISVFLILRQRK